MKYIFAVILSCLCLADARAFDSWMLDMQPLGFREGVVIADERVSHLGLRLRKLCSQKGGIFRYDGLAICLKTGAVIEVYGPKDHFQFLTLPLESEIGQLALVTEEDLDAVGYAVGSIIRSKMELNSGSFKVIQPVHFVIVAKPESKESLTELKRKLVERGCMLEEESMVPR